MIQGWIGWKRALATAFAVILSTLSVACDEDDPSAPDTSQNLPPTAYVALVGDPTSRPAHQGILLWWGEDPDGDIEGYAYHWTEPWRPGARDSRMGRLGRPSGGRGLDLSRDGARVDDGRC